MSVFLRLPKPANGPASGGREFSRAAKRRQQQQRIAAAAAQWPQCSASVIISASSNQRTTQKKTATVVSNRNENTVNYRKIPAGQAGATYMRQM